MAQEQSLKNKKDKNDKKKDDKKRDDKGGSGKNGGGAGTSSRKTREADASPDASPDAFSWGYRATPETPSAVIDSGVSTSTPSSTSTDVDPRKGRVLPLIGIGAGVLAGTYLSERLGSGSGEEQEDAVEDDAPGLVEKEPVAVGEVAKVRPREGRVLPALAAIPPLVVSGPVAGAIFIEGVGYVMKKGLTKLGPVIGEFNKFCSVNEIAAKNVSFFLFPAKGGAYEAVGRALSGIAGYFGFGGGAADPAPLPAEIEKVELTPSMWGKLKGWYTSGGKKKLEEEDEE